MGFRPLTSQVSKHLKRHLPTFCAAALFGQSALRGLLSRGLGGPDRKHQETGIRAFEQTLFAFVEAIEPAWKNRKMPFFAPRPRNWQRFGEAVRKNLPTFVALGLVLGERLRVQRPRIQQAALQAKNVFSRAASALPVVVVLFSRDLWTTWVKRGLESVRKATFGIGRMASIHLPKLHKHQAYTGLLTGLLALFVTMALASPAEDATMSEEALASRSRGSTTSASPKQAFVTSVTEVAAVPPPAQNESNIRLRARARGIARLQKALDTLQKNVKTSATASISFEEFLSSLKVGSDGSLQWGKEPLPIWQKTAETGLHRSAVERRRISDYSERPSTRSGSSGGGGGGSQPNGNDGNIEPHSHQDEAGGSVIGLNEATKGTLRTNRGGTGLVNYSTGDLLVGNALGTLSKLSLGATNEILTISNGSPVWAHVGVVANAPSDVRYVNQSGDTMTGTLTVDLTSGYLGLRILQTASGANFHATKSLSSSGTITATSTIATRGTLSGKTLTVMNGTSYLMGNVGIGTTAPKAKLDVFGTISGSRLSVSNNANISGALLVKGNVGIGTTLPTAKLDVVGTISGSGLRIKGGTAFTGATILTADASTTVPLRVKGAASQSASLQEWQNSAGTALSFITPSGSGSFKSIAIGKTPVNGRPFEVVGTISGSLITQNGAGSNYFMGNLGIGLTSPNGRLHIKTNTSGAQNGLTIEEGSGGPFAGNLFEVVRSNSTVGFAISSNASTITLTPTGNNWPTVISKPDIGTSVPTRFTVNSTIALDIDSGASNAAPSLKTYGPTQLAVTSGNVGIGTTTPGYKLEVTGDASVSSYSYLGGLRINGADDPNTIWNGASNLGITVNSGRKIYLSRVSDSSVGLTVETTNGYVGIGTTSPTTRLYVSGSGSFAGTMSGKSLYVTGTGAATAPLLYTNITTGKVGVGTATPESRMQVSGGGLCVGSDADCNTDNNTEGTIYSISTAMTVYDIAENYPTKDSSLTFKEMVSLDTANGVFVKRAVKGDKRLLGIISENPAVLLGGFNGAQFRDERQVAVALSGRVPVKVSLEQGEIIIGDPLTVSSTPGIAMKATETDQIIGYALEDNLTGGDGEIIVFVGNERAQKIPGAFGTGSVLAIGDSRYLKNTGGTISGSLSITGTLRLHGALTILDDATFEKNVTVNQKLTAGSLKVQGLVTLHNYSDCRALGTDASGNLTCGTTLVTGVNFGTGNVLAIGDARYLRIDGGDLLGNLSITGNLTVSDGAKIADNVIITKTGAIINSQLSILNSVSVSGSVAISSNTSDGTKDLLRLTSNVNGTGSTVFRVNASGAIFTNSAISSGGADYAEYFHAGLDGDGSQRLRRGEIVCIDPTRSNTVKRCEGEANTFAIGMISTRPSYIGNSVPGTTVDENGKSLPGYVLVGLMGQIYTRVIVENAEWEMGNGKWGTGSDVIKPGDALTTSSKPGYARKARPGEPSIGVALEGLTSGQGTINVLVSARNLAPSLAEIEKSIALNIEALAIGDEIEKEISETMASLKAAEGTKGTEGMEILHSAATTPVLLQGETQVGDCQKEQPYRSFDLKISASTSTGSQRFSNHCYGGLRIENGNLEFGSIANFSIDSTAPEHAGKLLVRGALYIVGDITIDGIATFLGDVEVQGQLVVSARQAGTAVIKAGETGVVVPFEPAFTQEPAVTVAADDFILSRVRNQSMTGFTIQIKEPMDHDVKFAWHALLTKAADPTSLSPLRPAVADAMAGKQGSEGQAELRGAGETEGAEVSDGTQGTSTSTATGSTESGASESATTEPPASSAPATAPTEQIVTPEKEGIPEEPVSAVPAPLEPVVTETETTEQATAPAAEVPSESAGE